MYARLGLGEAYELLPSVKIPPLQLDAYEVTTLVTGLPLEVEMPDDPMLAEARAYPPGNAVPQGLGNRDVDREKPACLDLPRACGRNPEGSLTPSRANRD